MREGLCVGFRNERRVVCGLLGIQNKLYLILCFLVKYYYVFLYIISIFDYYVVHPICHHNNFISTPNIRLYTKHKHRTSRSYALERSNFRSMGLIFPMHLMLVVRCLRLGCRKVQYRSTLN